MAMHNEFRGYGQVVDDPRIYRDPESGEFSRAMCAIGTIRAKRNNGDVLENVRYDCPMIRTRNVAQIEEMNTWKKGDMVDIKGTITSKDVNKASECPFCNSRNEVKGVVTYITPIFLKKRESNITHQMGINLLRSQCEISNSVKVIGMLVKDPDHYKADNGMEITRYELSVKRKFRIVEDSPDKKSDFVWVTSFGKLAKQDYEHLKKGSVVLIDGYLQTASYEKEVVCDNCGEKYNKNDSSTQVVPFSVEYLKNLIEEEEQEKRKAEEDEQAVQSVLEALNKN